MLKEQSNVSVSLINKPKSRRVPADLPIYDFTLMKQRTGGMLLSGTSHVARMLQKVRQECLKVVDETSLFQVKFSKSMKLDEFTQVQTYHRQNYSMFLRETWLTSIKKMLKTHLSELSISLGNGGKGWFDTNQTDNTIYRMSKLARLMILIRLMIQDTMRSLIFSSVQSYYQLFASVHEVLVQSTTDKSMSVGKLNEKGSQIRRALLIIEFIVRQGIISANTDFATMEQAILGAIDSAILIPTQLADIEPSVASKLFWSHQPEYMTTYTAASSDAPLTAKQRDPNVVQDVGESTDSFVTRKKSVIKSMLVEVFATVSYTLADLKKRYESRIQMDPVEFIQQYMARDPAPSLNDMVADVNIYREEFVLSETEISRWIHAGICQLSTDSIRFAVRKDFSHCVIEAIARHSHTMLKSTDEVYTELDATVGASFSTIEEIARLKEFMESCNTSEKLLQARDSIKEVVAFQNQLELYLYEIPREDITLRWKIVGWPRRLQTHIESVKQSMASEEPSMLKSLLSDQEVFAEKMRTLQSNVADLQNAANVATKGREYVGIVNRTEVDIKEMQASIAMLNTREQLFCLAEGTRSEPFVALTRDFEPYKLVWKCWSEWTQCRQEWMVSSFHKLDSERIERDVSAIAKTLIKCTKTFGGESLMSQMITKLKEDVESFKSNLPLIQGLRNPGMRDRHWQILQEQIGHRLDPSITGLTLQRLVEMDISPHATLITKIGDLAGKEYSIETALNKMAADWITVKLESMAYRQTGTFICRVAEDITRLLDDHITMTQSMNFSPFKKFFTEQISSWNNQLRMAQDILDVLSNAQRSWLYLEPIFASADIVQQLPVESRKFIAADKIWRKIMSQIHDQPVVMRFSSDQTILPALMEVVRVLEVVSKGLTTYLDSKRMRFPRFYFLSDEELLQIISQTKDPLSVQPHLSKCFENVNKLVFEDPDETGARRIMAMVSGEGEIVPFHAPFYPEGSVEDWLMKVESMMKESVHASFQRAMVDYVKTSRIEWVQHHPGQIIIAASQVHWTEQVAQGIITNSLDRVIAKLNSQLDDLVKLVRQDVPKLLRMILGDLIVIEVHARDVAHRIKESNVTSINDFEWISQLRYEWLVEEAVLNVKILNASFPYGNEYLGNTGRLVITPLTDKCYLTLASAMNLNFGGAPSGMLLMNVFANL